MSYAIHAYLMEEKKIDDATLFNSVKNLFLRTERIQFTITKNIFTKKDYLKLTIDNCYSISIFLIMILLFLTIWNIFWEND